MMSFVILLVGFCALVIRAFSGLAVCPGAEGCGAGRAGFQPGLDPGQDILQVVEPAEVIRPFLAAQILQRLDLRRSPDCGDAVASNAMLRRTVEMIASNP